MKQHIRAFLENLLAGLRTAGALLIGNAFLVYHGIVGAQAAVAQVILINGVLVLAISSFPWTTAIKFFRS